MPNRIRRRMALTLPLGLLAACAGQESVTAAALASGPALDLAPASPALGFAQGGLALGRVPPGSRVTLDGRPVQIGADGRFAIGFAREADGDARLAVTTPDGRNEIRAIAVLKRDWDVQRINGLPPTMVNPNAQQLTRIQRERTLIANVRRIDSDLPYFAEGFSWPTHGRISGVFGSQRILNGEPRAPHLGLDIAVPTGTPVTPMAPGRVVLAEDLYWTGNTVLVDHGRGVVSLYAHLSRIDTHKDAMLERGQVLGAVGATGRVTGPHLHLGLNWLTTSLDPRPLLPEA